MLCSNLAHLLAKRVGVRLQVAPQHGHEVIHDLGHGRLQKLWIQTVLPVVQRAKAQSDEVVCGSLHRQSDNESPFLQGNLTRV